MWKKAEYSKAQINRAGARINNPDISEEEKRECLRIIDNWRAAHAFPMNTFAINLKHQVAEIDSAIVVQRLKRLDTILDKLKRYPDMELYRMQDLGGCRVILPKVEDVYALKKRLNDSRIRHEEHNCKDYIAIPKSDTGYRSLHVIYRYKSDKKKDYNGLQVEIQIRTRLQHLWATAVETVGVFTQNGLKFNQGSDRWLRFFKVVSALFSLEENTAVVEGVSTDVHEIIAEIHTITNELNVIEKLYTIGLATQHVGRITKSKTPGYYLLTLDIEHSRLAVEKFTGIEKATEQYNKVELQKATSLIDVVLVSAQSFDALTHAYPNYFADIREFTRELVRIRNKHETLG